MPCISHKKLYSVILPNGHLFTFPALAGNPSASFFICLLSFFFPREGACPVLAARLAAQPNRDAFGISFFLFTFTFLLFTFPPPPHNHDFKNRLPENRIYPRQYKKIIYTYNDILKK